MSYEKINELIEQAPEVSQWWASNKRALNWWCVGSIAVIFPIFLMTFLSVAATVVWSGMWLAGEVPADKYWMLISAPLVSLCGIGVIKYGRKFRPKRFTYEGFTLARFAESESVSLAFTHNVLSKAVNLGDPQIKPILAKLHALKNTDLPKCWWQSLGKELDKHARPPVNTSAQEQLEAVYVQMEDLSVDQPTPKVFRL